jgi:hypothetical protein
MDFIIGLPLTARKFVLIWVLMDRLSKSAHLIPVNTKYRVEKYAEIYIARALCLHGVPKTIISDQGSQFMARFWEQLHAQTDGQTERVNQILEDMLRACIMDYQGSWSKNLPWAEFLYNNSYQESLKMAPFDVLYRRRFHTPLNWIEPREKVIFGPNIIDEAQATVHRIQDNLKVVKSRQETYENKRCRPLEFEVRKQVYLRVSPMKGMKRFGVKGKLAPRYIKVFPILEKCGPVAYKMELPPSLAGVHNIFHESQPH